MNRFDKLDLLKSRLNSLRPLPPEVVQNLYEDLVLRWTYNSNAIEGNTLTLKETKVALEVWYNKMAGELHTVELAARLHSDFVKIHPFVDGNGRTARLIMNFELMKGGFPAVILPVERRLEYYEALDRSHVHGDYDPFIEIITGLVEQSFAPYWHALGIKE